MTKRSRSIWPLWVGILTITLFGISFGLWSTQTQIAGAIVAQGRIEPVTSPHEISYPKIGIVAEVLVRDDDVVEAGDLLVRFDSSLLMVERESVEKSLVELFARRLRLQAIRDGETLPLSLPVDHPYFDFPGLQAEIDAQNDVLSNIQERLHLNHELEEQRALQVLQQINGIESQLEGISDEIEIFQGELNRLLSLQVNGLVKTAEVALSRRELIAKSAEQGRLVSRRSELQERLAELRLTALTINEDEREKAQIELDRISPQFLALTRRHTEILLELRYLDIHAPIGGVVYDMKIKGDGFVHRAGQPLLTLIPTNSELTANVRVTSRDIDQIHLDQMAILRFAAYNARALPAITGNILTIAPDVIVDPITRLPYYEITISAPDTAFDGVIANEIVNGMSVTAFVQTDMQTPFEYVTRPIVEYFSVSLRDR